MDLQNRVIIVTGAARGIGEALCRRFATEGPRHIVVADLDGDLASEVASSLDCSASSYQVDVSDSGAVSSLVEATLAEQAQIDLFFSNAGILTRGGEEVSDEDWERIWKINVHAHVAAARAVLPGMLDRAEGYIGSTASAAGLLAQIGSAPYSVTKHAAVAFAEWLAITYGTQGIRVSVLCPQAVATNMTAGVEGGGVAGLDGMLSAEEVADVAARGIADERFLLLPHPEVADYERRRSDDRERWLAGMQRLNDRFGP
ncbi:MAG: SDR family oxidoreductase [Acidimicrobiales bacterium]